MYIYKTKPKPIWANGIQLCGTASTSNTEILVRFLSKALRMIAGAPCYVPNTIIRKDIQLPAVKEEISLSIQCSPQFTPKLISSYQTTGDCEDIYQMICIQVS
jgi:hypothetical protein